MSSRERRPKLKAYQTQPFLLTGAMISCEPRDRRLDPTGYLKLQSCTKDLGWIQVGEAQARKIMGFAQEFGDVAKLMQSPTATTDIRSPSYVLLDEPLILVLAGKKVGAKGRTVLDLRVTAIETARSDPGFNAGLAMLERVFTVADLVRVADRKVAA